jgi:hypothetical protein
MNMKVSINKLIILYIIFAILLFIINNIIGLSFVIIFGILVLIAKPKLIYPLFIFSCLTTEFYYIHFAGGVLRPYHLLAVVVFICLLPKMGLLFKSKVFIILLIFLLFALVSCLQSSYSVIGALTSFLSVLLNFVVAINIALILITQRISFEKYLRILLFALLVSIVWGLIQFSAHNLFGIDLSLSMSQIDQVGTGIIPSFRTESNTFGKYVVYMLVMGIPLLIRSKLKKLKVLYILIGIVLLINFTRSAIYGLFIAIPYILFWYTRERKTKSAFKAIMLIVIFATVTFLLMNSGIIKGGEYAFYKVNNFLNLSDVKSDSSAAYRMENMKIIIEGSLESIKTILFGKGWGQTYYVVQNVLTQVGGNDILSIYGFTGALGLLIYIVFLLGAKSRCKNLAIFARDDTDKLIGETFNFLWVTVTAIGLFSGMLISPEYWMMIGGFIFVDTRYCDLKKRRYEGL